MEIKQYDIITASDINTALSGKSNTDHNHDSYLKLSGGTMTGTIKGTDKKGNWHTIFPTTDTSKTIQSAFYVPSNAGSPGLAQGVLSWRTADNGDAYAIANYEANTTRLRYISKENLDNYVNSTNDVFWIKNGIMNVPTPALP
jgi:hypothetical protein